HKKSPVFGKQSVEPVDSLNFGVSYESTLCTLPDIDDLENELVDLGWMLSETDKPASTSEILQSLDNQGKIHVFDKSEAISESPFDSFTAELEKLWSEQVDKRLVVYVHGCCID